MKSVKCFMITICCILLALIFLNLYNLNRALYITNILHVKFKNSIASKTNQGNDQISNEAACSKTIGNAIIANGIKINEKLKSNSNDKEYNNLEQSRNELNKNILANPYEEKRIDAIEKKDMTDLVEGSKSVTYTENPTDSNTEREEIEEKRIDEIENKDMNDLIEGSKSDAYTENPTARITSTERINHENPTELSSTTNREQTSSYTKENTLGKLTINLRSTTSKDKSSNTYNSSIIDSEEVTNTKQTDNTDKQSFTVLMPNNITQNQSIYGNNSTITLVKNLTTDGLKEQNITFNKNTVDNSNNFTTTNEELKQNATTLSEASMTKTNTHANNFDLERLTYTSSQFVYQKNKSNFTGLSKKKILLYTPLFGDIPWPHVPFDYQFTNLDKSPCEFNHCEITYDKNELNKSDVALFHGRDIEHIKPEYMKSLRKKINNNKQIWIWFMMESPLHAFYNTSLYNGIFNWTATYRKDSDIFIPYYSTAPLTTKEKHEFNYVNYAKQKDKMVVIIVSNCFPERINFIKELQKYVQVDVYGGCKNRFNPELGNCPRHTKECDQLLSRYKFYLSIENSFCKDYATEKYFLKAKQTLVPIMLGAKNFTNILLPNSFINIRDFKSIKNLSEYLKYLDKNDTAYNAYHTWRSDYKFESQHGMCKVCKALWMKNNAPAKVVNIGDLWNPNTCDDKNELYEKYSV